MRYVFAAIAAFLISQADTHAQTADPSACAPYRAKWDSVASRSDVAAMDSAIRVIPSLCPVLSSEAKARRASLAREIAVRAPPPDPCAKSAAEWASVQTGDEAALTAYRDKTPAACPALRGQAQARLDALAAAAATARAALLKQPITDAVWVARPSGRDYERFYPDNALRSGTKGAVSLDCVAESDGELACAIASETPPEMGFGAAALAIARSYRIAAQTKSGAPSAGRHITVQIKFAVGG